jgi:hypothetical protein
LALNIPQVTSMDEETTQACVSISGRALAVKIWLLAVRTLVQSRVTSSEIRSAKSGSTAEYSLSFIKES